MLTSVFAPASIGNVSVGYDVLGAAIKPIDGTQLGDVVTVVTKQHADINQVDLEVTGTWADKLPADQQSNIVVMCAYYYLERVVQIPHKLVLKLEKNLPVGSGLGSSASSIVAALHSLNNAFDGLLNDVQLLKLMGDFEGQISGSVHYDNVAPSFLGGIQLMIDNPEKISVNVPVFENWFWVMAYSGHALSTAKMRELVPVQVPIKTALKFGQNLATFVHASHQQDEALACSVLRDVIAEPTRGPAIEGFENVKSKLNKLVVLACGISGSGPTMFAVTNNLSSAEQVLKVLKSDYVNDSLGGFAHICKIDQSGSQALTDSMPS